MNTFSETDVLCSWEAPELFLDGKLKYTINSQGITLPRLKTFSLTKKEIVGYELLPWERIKSYFFRRWRATTESPPIDIPGITRANLRLRVKGRVRLLNIPIMEADVERVESCLKKFIKRNDEFMFKYFLSPPRPLIKLIVVAVIFMIFFILMILGFSEMTSVTLLFTLAAVFILVFSFRYCLT